MKVLIINGSPKIENSNSEVLVNKLNNYINADIIQINRKNYKQDFSDIINNYDTLIFAFPLYVDGIPSHLLESLTNLTIENKNVYAIVNCGFPEGNHAKQGLDIIRNYCIHNNLNYKGGLGIGGCGGLNGMSKNRLLKFINVNINKYIKDLSNSILANEEFNNVLTKINIPNYIYRHIGNMSWKKDLDKLTHK